MSSSRKHSFRLTWTENMLYLTIANTSYLLNDNSDYYIPRITVSHWKGQKKALSLNNTRLWHKHMWILEASWVVRFSRLFLSESWMNLLRLSIRIYLKIVCTLYRRYIEMQKCAMLPLQGEDKLRLQRYLPSGKSIVRTKDIKHLYQEWGKFWNKKCI